MARNKKYNRRSEFAYQNMELYGILGEYLLKEAYPDKEIHEAGR